MEEQILELIRHSGLPRIADEITHLLMSSIRMRLHTVQEETLAIGASKVGGLPDLPPETPWPEWKGTPLSFIAQIRLSDIATYDREGVLPHTGMLSFFCVDEGQLWTYDPGTNRGGYVLYEQSDPSRLLRRPAPASLPASSRFTPCAIDFSLELTLPAFESPSIKRLGLYWEAMYGDQAIPQVREEGERYIELSRKLEQLYGNTLRVHRLLGHPDPIQVTDMPDDERLLLQIDSDGAPGMDWGDTGRLYYLIPRQALAARNFEQVWLDVQCT